MGVHLTKRVVDLEGVESTEELHFFYDAQSRPAFVEYQGTMYRYIHNLQGDIVAIVDAAGTRVVEYKYDAWGSILSNSGSMWNSLGILNPFRYRQYVQDEETELYYLMTRFYDAKIQRFSSSDIYLNVAGGLISSNTYAYCYNASIINADSDGKSGYLTIFAHQDHAWIVIEEESGMSTAYGTWGYSDGGWPKGLCKDREKKLISTDETYEGRVSLTAYISDAQETSLYEFISNNQGWSLFKNCAHFAAKAWEAAGQDKLGYTRLGIPYPSALARSIREQEGHSIDYTWYGTQSKTSGKRASSSSNPSSSVYSSVETADSSSVNSSGITYSGSSLGFMYHHHFY